VSAITDLTAVVNTMLGEYGVTREQIADLAAAPTDGGPNGNGWYPVTRADGETVLVPSILKMLSLTAAARGPLVQTWSALEALASTAAVGDEYTVDPSDTGTHSEPVTGTVNNAGTYQFVVGTPNYFKRTGNLLQTDLANAVQEMQDLKDSVFDDEGFQNVQAALTAINALGPYLSEIEIAADNIADIQAAADLVAPAPIFVGTPRAFASTDNQRQLFLNLNGPGTGTIQNMVIPSNSTTPLPQGTRFNLANIGGAFVRFVNDTANEAVVTVYGDGPILKKNGEAVLIKTGTNTWALFGYGLMAQTSAMYNLPKVWVDPSDLAMMFQERTGGSATTPVAVGQPIGSIKNKGSGGGWFIAVEDSRRPILRQTGALYWFETDGTDDFLELSGVPINLAQLFMFVGAKVLTEVFGDGIILFQPAINSDVNRNDGGYLGMNGAGEMVWRFGTPFIAPTAAGVIHKVPHVFEYHKAGNADYGATFVDNSAGNIGQALPTLTNQAGKIMLAARSANNGYGAGQFGHVGFYSVILGDEILTTEQKNAMRGYAYAKTRLPPPLYPVMANLTARDAARATLISEVFSGAGIPTTTATLTSETASSVGFGSVTGLASFQKATIPGYTLRPRVLTPTVPRNDATVFIWIGHSTALATYNTPVIAQELVNRGFRVVMLPLPGSLVNDYTAGSPGEHENAMTPLKDWIGPVSIMMNTFRVSYPTMKFYMAGISGGGWATQFCAAVDDRILGSTQFVGSLPDFIYLARDWEQRLPGLTADFLTLYLLAASNGWHNHVLYENDPVGFSRATYNSQGIDWSPTLKAQAIALGGNYDLSWVNWNQHNFQLDSFTAQFINRLPAAP